MLISIKVHNIALIEEAEIAFQSGMHVLSGETGAGKSILIDSINLILGERADRDLIRSGCEKANVEAWLDISDSAQALEILREEQIEPEGSVISIQREISVSGKNVCRVCGNIVPLVFLKKLTSCLVDVHGQHDHQRLLDPKTHLSFLDSFGDEDFFEKKAKVSSAYHTWKDASSRFAQLRKENARRLERTDYLSARVRELDEVNLQIGESDQLAAEKTRMSFSEKIASSLNLAYQDLCGGSHDTTCLQSMKQAFTALSSIENVGEEYAKLAERMKTAYYECEELSLEIRKMSEDESFDAGRFEEIEARLDRIRKLERKYQMTADELVSYHADIKEELEHLNSLDDRIHHAEIEFRTSLQQYRQEAAVLTDARRQIAERLEKLVETQLFDLGMQNTRFSCVFEMNGNDGKVIPTAEGDDNIVFYIAPNPGEPLKPLDKTASGGELSRIMLALKTCAADRYSIPTIIFDEVDTGISGHVAQAVAEKMGSIGCYHQVLCITHLAQIASMADVHFLVSKYVSDGRTYTNVQKLDSENRVSEIARLIGVTQKDQQSGLHHAESILKNTEQWKKEHNIL